MQRVRYLGRLLWIGISVANNLWWLWTLGLATLAAGLGGFLTSLTGIETLWAIIIALALFLIVAAVVLGDRGKRELVSAHAAAEQLMRDDRLWPTRWQRLRHPLTPVGKLPVNVPPSAAPADAPASPQLRADVQERSIRRGWNLEDRQQEAAELRRAALQLRTELRDIRNKIANLRKDATIPDGFSFPAFEWDRHRDLLASDAELYGKIEEAYTAAHRLNEIFVWRRTIATTKLIGVNVREDPLDEAADAAKHAILELDRIIETP